MREYILYEVHIIIFFYNLLHMPTYYKLLNRIRLGHVDLNGLSCTLILVAYTYESVALLHQVSNEYSFISSLLCREW